MNNKPFEFHGTPGGYFKVFLVSLISAYIPLFGWAFSFNYTNEWVADNLTISGRRITYHAEYWDTFKFLLKNLLLIIITLGIYVFWFTPKQYRYIVDHASFVEQAQL